MDNSDVVEFTQTWAGAFAAVGKEATDIAIEMAFEVLKGHELADIKRAVMTHISTSPYPPKPSDINELINGDPESRKLKAWSMVEDAIRRVGGHESVVFDDPATMVVIEEMGGWIGLCKITDKELPFKRNEFVKRMTPYLHTPPTDHPKRLCGVNEQANRGQYPELTQEPKLIGNPERARLVYEGGETRKIGFFDMKKIGVGG